MIQTIQCLDKEVQPLIYSKCFSLTYHSKSTPPDVLPPKTLSLSKYFRAQASAMARCSGCLVRWAPADDMIVWSAPRSSDHPAGSCCNNDQQARQETGNRMKKAGHPVLLDQRAKHDITNASLIQTEEPDQRPNVLLLCFQLTPAKIHSCLRLPLSLSASLSVSCSSLF